MKCTLFVFVSLGTLLPTAFCADDIYKSPGGDFTLVLPMGIRFKGIDDQYGVAHEFEMADKSYRVTRHDRWGDGSDEAAKRQCREMWKTPGIFSLIRFQERRHGGYVCFDGVEGMGGSVPGIGDTGGDVRRILLRRGVVTPKYIYDIKTSPADNSFAFMNGFTLTDKEEEHDDNRSDTLRLDGVYRRTTKRRPDGEPAIGEYLVFLENGSVYFAGFVNTPNSQGVYSTDPTRSAEDRHSEFQQIDFQEHPPRLRKLIASTEGATRFQKTEYFASNGRVAFSVNRNGQAADDNDLYCRYDGCVTDGVLTIAFYREIHDSRGKRFSFGEEEYEFIEGPDGNSPVAELPEKPVPIPEHPAAAASSLGEVIRVATIAVEHRMIGVRLRLHYEYVRANGKSTKESLDVKVERAHGGAYPGIQVRNERGSYSIAFPDKYQSIQFDENGDMKTVSVKNGLRNASQSNPLMMKIPMSRRDENGNKVSEESVLRLLAVQLVGEIPPKAEEAVERRIYKSTEMERTTVRPDDRAAISRLSSESGGYSGCFIEVRGKDSDRRARWNIPKLCGGPETIRVHFLTPTATEDGRAMCRFRVYGKADNRESWVTHSGVFEFTPDTGEVLSGRYRYYDIKWAQMRN